MAYQIGGWRALAGERDGWRAHRVVGLGGEAVLDDVLECDLLQPTAAALVLALGVAAHELLLGEGHERLAREERDALDVASRAKAPAAATLPLVLQPVRARIEFLNVTVEIS